MIHRPMFYAFCIVTGLVFTSTWGYGHSNASSSTAPMSARDRTISTLSEHELRQSTADERFLVRTDIRREDRRIARRENRQDDRRLDRRADRREDRQFERRIDRRADRQLDRRIDRRQDRQIERRMDRRADRSGHRGGRR